jgi:ribosomal protein L32
LANLAVLESSRFVARVDVEAVKHDSAFARVKFSKRLKLQEQIHQKCPKTNKSSHAHRVCPHHHLVKQLAFVVKTTINAIRRGMKVVTVKLCGTHGGEACSVQTILRIRIRLGSRLSGTVSSIKKLVDKDQKSQHLR